MEKETTTRKCYNIFRDSPVRYLGYANEVGESLRYQFPKLVIPSYIVAFGYCFADAGASGYNTYHESRNDSSNAELHAVLSACDCLLWQSLASVMIPGATINAIVKACRFAVSRGPGILPVTATTWLPTMVGLGSIPLIIRPIDHFVDMLMDSTYRKVDFASLLSVNPKREAENIKKGPADKN
jgi:fission process protein 1